MFKKAAKLAVNVSVMLVTSVYAGYDEDMAVINKGMPTPVKQFNKRQIECNHWAGEEPYDSERAAEINAAIIKLRCGMLENEEKLLLKKYKARPDISQSIKKAKASIWSNTPTYWDMF